MRADLVARSRLREGSILTITYGMNVRTERLVVHLADPDLGL